MEFLYPPSMNALIPYVWRVSHRVALFKRATTPIIEVGKPVRTTVDECIKTSSPVSQSYYLH